MNKRPHKNGELLVAFHGNKACGYGIGYDTTPEKDLHIIETDRVFSRRNHRGHFTCDHMEKLGFCGSFGVVLTYNTELHLKDAIGMVIDSAVLYGTRYYRMLFGESIYWIQESALTKITKRMQKTLTSQNK